MLGIVVICGDLASHGAADDDDDDDDGVGLCLFLRGPDACLGCYVLCRITQETPSCRNI